MAGKTTSKATQEELMRAIMKAYNDHDTEALGALLSDDVVFTDPNGVHSGKEAVLANEQEFFDAFPDCVWPMESVHLFIGEDPETIALTWSLRGTQTGAMSGLPATGKKLELSGVNIGKVHDGLLTEATFYFDNYDLMAQLGLVPKGDSIAFKALALTEFAVGKAKDALHV
jgi:steroid delta-isomerase-like uncharacterized protein